MRAVRIQKRRKGKPADLYVWHFLTDDEGTRCGREVNFDNAVEEADLEALPAAEACHGCQRVVEYHAQPWGEKAGLARWGVASPAPQGRISKAGPLRQTGRSGHGQALR